MMIKGVRFAKVINVNYAMTPFWIWQAFAKSLRKKWTIAWFIFKAEFARYVNMVTIRMD